VPADLRKALAVALPGARKVWLDITPIARRDWIHWIASAKQAETRASDQNCLRHARQRNWPCMSTPLCQKRIKPKRRPRRHQACPLLLQILTASSVARDCGHDLIVCCSTCRMALSETGFACCFKKTSCVRCVRFCPSICRYWICCMNLSHRRRIARETGSGGG
jgi:hypothetical protein